MYVGAIWQSFIAINSKDDIWLSVVKLKDLIHCLSQLHKESCPIQVIVARFLDTENVSGM